MDDQRFWAVGRRLVQRDDRFGQIDPHKSASLLKPLQADQFDASRPKPLTCVGPNRDQPWGYRYYEITPVTDPAAIRGCRTTVRVDDHPGSIHPTRFR